MSKYQDYLITNLQDQMEPQIQHKYVLGDLGTNKLTNDRKSQFRKFIAQAIDQTRTVREKADESTAITFGVQKKWKRANREYFMPEQTYRITALDFRSQSHTPSIQFDKWKRNPTIAENRSRMYSQSQYHHEPLKYISPKHQTCRQFRQYNIKKQ